MSSEHDRLEPVVIRAARPDDAEQMAVLCGQLGYPASAEQVRERLGRVQQEEANGVFVAQAADGEVLGWVQVYVRALVAADVHAELGGLVVGEGHRCQAVGRRLMEQVEAWARAHGCGAVYVRSNVIREAAHRFYEGIGYCRMKTQFTFWKALI